MTISLPFVPLILLLSLPTTVSLSNEYDDDFKDDSVETTLVPCWIHSHIAIMTVQSSKYVYTRNLRANEEGKANNAIM